MAVDIVFTNADVLTLDERGTRGGSIAISNGRIAGVWSTPEPPRSHIDLSSRTKVINLEGATVLPGFIDTHSHPLMYAQCCLEVDCRIERAENI